ncbi:MAG: tRNA uridine(34) 5-carboxymethylaminomethyl modification radical SAM/GNAT enzyme Elp3 [Candidatus Aenigmarchaeota archaeon]|nr:tRNA uridine(34) 5-carboxymethylaminomethyl modification radical SAM/GNAT enzyme Elp3 [Candidatus Aenigmarchaeota archaeon]
MSLQDACNELIEKIKSGAITSQASLEKEKVLISKKYMLDKIIKNADIMAFADDEKIRKFLLTKPTRTLSGVANIAVMWMNKKSCIGSCIYCPQGEYIDTKGVRLVPKSYTGSEPATMRALRLNYDPYLQVQNRLKQLKAIGHPTDKCELIIMGGTFMLMSKKYQEQFVQRCLDAFNKSESKTLAEAQKKNESAANRCIGLTIETRSDYCKKAHIKQMLKLGCTRVELGVQSTDDKILKKIKRNHGTRENIYAIRLLKEAGLKVCAHWMPGLTGLEKMNLKKELRLFKALFLPDYMPDELKIYPTLVIQGTKLYELWNNGKYKELTIDQASDLLIAMKKIVPPYTRIKRIMRDISEKEVAAGPATTNLRQLTNVKMAKLGISCNCIRCREVGIKGKLPEKVTLNKIEYNASGGKEIFLSFEDMKNKILLAFLRLRIDKDKIAKVRELHVYGPMIELGKQGGYQHKGLGKKLLSEAEELSKKHEKHKIQVTSGIGAREYYRKLGYKLESSYMTKKI